MKRAFIFLLVSGLCCTTSFSQGEDLFASDKKVCLTAGILQGGGSLVGVDVEILATGRLGFQAGAGYIGYGLGINYHLQPYINSSFICLGYWHQGIGDSFAQSMIGPSFVLRTRKIFTAQLGIAIPLDTGPALEGTDYIQPPVMLTYSVGIFIPL
ncbi:MAG TPA: hypothetical protein VMW76_10410 [Bacteroidales bacterium]|nr:hypothetical protein [Bacteroidales bacterium]